MNRKDKLGIWGSRLIFYIGLVIILWSHNSRLVQWTFILIALMFICDVGLFFYSLYWKKDANGSN